LGALIIESKQGELVWGACPYFQQLNSIIQLNANGSPYGFSVISVFSSAPPPGRGAWVLSVAVRSR
jgi:hypothetical protein